MKAWRVSRHGGLEALEWLEVPDPMPGPGEIRVRVEAVSLNHLDLWVRRGIEGHRFPLPLTLGCDVCGRIESFGPGAESRAPELKAGTRVVLGSWVSCGRCGACLSGDDPMCPRLQILGETRDGGCADFVVAPVENAFRCPDGLGAPEASTVPIASLTAWSMLHDKARVRAGDLVLVHAAGSGVSVASIQIAKLAGATVIATASTEAKREKALRLGADHALPYEGFRESVRALAKSKGKGGVDIALDHLGKQTFAETLGSLDRGGRLVFCGATTGSTVSYDLKAVFFKNQSVLGSTLGSRAHLPRILGLMAAGKLKAVVDSIFPMKDYPVAQSRLEDRSVFGKVVVTQ